MKLVDLIRARNVLFAHANDRVSGRLAYRMAKFVGTSQNEADFYTSKVRSIMEEYGSKDDAGNLIKDGGGDVMIDLAKLDECKAAVRDLENTEVDAPAIRFSQGDLQEIRLAMADVLVLAEFIQEED